MGGIDTDERIKKRAVGKAVYKAGTEFFDFSPDWGILTGVRPVKLADELMIKAAEALSRNHCKSNGQNNSESLTDVYLGCTEVSRTAEEILIRDYCTSSEKARLLTSVAKEKRCLSSRLKRIHAVFISQFRSALQDARTARLFHTLPKSF